MLNLHKDHKNLVRLAFSVFVMLSIGIAIVPAYQMQEYQPIPGQSDLTPSEKRGLQVYIAEGCVACHTQQVRNIEMDNVWGARPSMASDYYYSKQRLDVWRQSPSLLGSERTGPDLTDIGTRQPSDQWHLLHLYNPRLVVDASIMPKYPWLFTITDTTAVNKDDVTLPRDITNMKGSKVVMANRKALDLVAYLKSLQQFDLTDIAPSPTFIPATAQKPALGSAENKNERGKVLYQNTCAACHQGNGRGVKGAFPPLANSLVVNNKNPDKLIKIILMGYDARPEYGAMPSFASQLKDDEIKAIADHERSSWGNNAPAVPIERIKQLRDSISQLNLEVQ